VNVLVGGYQDRAKKLRESINDSFSQYEDNLSDLDCFEMLAKKETIAIPNRINELEGLLGVHKSKEKELQNRYATLQREKDNLKSLLEE